MVSCVERKHLDQGSWQQSNVTSRDKWLVSYYLILGYRWVSGYYTQVGSKREVQCNCVNYKCSPQSLLCLAAAPLLV